MKFKWICFIALFVSFHSLDAADLSTKKCQIRLLQTTDLRAHVSFDGVALVPLLSKDRANLKKLYSIPDTNRFFLGNKNANEAVLAHLKSAKNPHAGSRDSFAGRWAIEFNGNFAGYLEMVAVEASFFPAETADVFVKKNPEDLYLSVGYALDPGFRGNGIATRALNLAIQFAKEVLKPKYFFASTNILNEASQNVLLRNGFQIIQTSDTKRIKFVLENNDY